MYFEPNDILLVNFVKFVQDFKILCSQKQWKPLKVSSHVIETDSEASNFTLLFRIIFKFWINLHIEFCITNCLNNILITVSNV